MHPQDTPALEDAEEWRPVPGYEGFYSVSSLGRVRRDCAGQGTYAGRILAPRRTGNHGYLQCNLGRTPGHTKSVVLVHTLVAAAFLGEGPAGYEVNHIDRRHQDE